jgi:AcrR family transcriptional regulator
MPRAVARAPSRTRVRAVALPPEERRTAIIDAVHPLLLEHGSSITTRQIAEAAGIAEGTIFRVFADKDELIGAVVERVFDPTSVDQALASIDLDEPLTARLVAAVEILQRRVTEIWQLMTAVGMSKPPDRYRAGTGGRDAPTIQVLASIFESDRARLRRDPIAAAQLLRGLTFACSHPALADDGPASPDEIVSLLLDGIRKPEPSTRRKR